MGDDVDLLKKRTIAVALEAVVPDEEHRRRLSDAAERMHRITIDATELVAVHLVRCVEARLPLPTVDADFYKLAMMTVTHGEGERRKIDEELERTLQRLPIVERASRENLNQAMMAQSKSLAACFDTNLHVHLRKRVARYVRLLRQAQQPTDKPGKKLHKLANLRICSDVCRERGRALESQREHHGVVESLRAELGLDELTSPFMSTNVERHQGAMLRATHELNRRFEQAGERGASICPLRRGLVPSFIQVDTEALKHILGLDSSEYERGRARDSRENTKRKKRNAALRARVEFPPLPKELRRRSKAVASLRRAMRLESEEALQSQRDAAARLQKSWRRNRRVDICRIARRHPGALVMLQRIARGYLVRRAIAQEATRRALGEHKGVRWESVLDLDRKKVCRSRSDTFAGSMRTDGVSARLLFHKGSERKGTKRKRTTRHCPVPKRGLYVIDELKHLERMQHAQIVGADPGKRELLVLYDDDGPEPMERSNPNRTWKASVRYTAAQRRHETGLSRHDKERATLKPAALKEATDAMTDTNSRSATVDGLLEYIRRRREWLGDGLAHHRERWHRKRRWQRFIEGQVSFSKFVERIESMRHSDDFVIGYGSWASVAGRPGAPCNRGHPPCIGKGLRTKLSKHFCVVITPESYTSQTCSLCGSRCGACEEVDAAHRHRRIANAGGDPEKLRKAQRFSVRGLRRCTNNACAAFLNRDRNAAANIQKRCRSLLTTGQDDSLSLDEAETALDSLQREIDCGD